MVKKQVAKPQEAESQTGVQYIETRLIKLDPQMQDDMKKYVEFFVEKELTLIKDQLLPLTQKLQESLREFNNLQLMVGQSLPKFREEDVLSLYEHGNISLGRVAELCNLKYDKMIDKLVEKGIKLKFGPENIEEAREEEKVFRAKMKEC